VRRTALTVPLEEIEYRIEDNPDPKLIAMYERKFESLVDRAQATLEPILDASGVEGTWEPSWPQMNTEFTIRRPRPGAPFVTLGTWTFTSSNLKPIMTLTLGGKERILRMDRGSRGRGTDLADYKEFAKIVAGAFADGLKQKPTKEQRFLRWARDWQTSSSGAAKAAMYQFWKENKNWWFFKDMRREIASDSGPLLKRKGGNLLLFRHENNENWRPPRGRVESYTTWWIGLMGISTSYKFAVEVPLNKVLFSYEHADKWFKQGRGGEGEFLVLPGNYKAYRVESSEKTRSGYRLLPLR